MQSNIILDESLDYVKDHFDTKNKPENKYHNWNHTLRVYNSVKELVKEDDELSDQEILNLQLAALFHDTGYCKKPENHERISADIAVKFLESKGIDSTQVDQIKRLILATDPTHIAVDELEKLIQDADMSGLASRDYRAISESLRLELNNTGKGEIYELDWALKNIKFLKEHRYKSQAGIKLYEKAKQKNLKRLKKKTKAMKEDLKVQTIASSKSAQTQLKTALRNHIDLSAIADNKANMMLSINAMILTIGLPLLISVVSQYPQLKYSIALLSLVCIASMIFATLATRPINMKGMTSLKDIPLKKSNLFFFGNFYKMPFDDFEKGIKDVIADNDLLDNSITRDLFFLGKSLGTKYDQLRLCYNIFMYGLASTVLLAVLLFCN